MIKAAPSDRLISFNHAAAMVGFKSRTSLYSAIKTDPSFPRPIYRGRNQFFLESELLAYLEHLAAQRDTPESSAQAETAKQASQRMLAGKAAKRARHSARDGGSA
ncbi:MAG: hypothetical protein PHP86_03835 [Nevskiales bacterium]|nr:hypothetical protein [Nevskiales bacterium]